MDTEFMDSEFLFITLSNIRQSFENYAYYLTSKLAKPTLEGIKLRCERLDILWAEFIRVREQLATKFDRRTDFLVYEALYLDIKEQYLVRINELQSRSHPVGNIDSTSVIKDLGIIIRQFTKAIRLLLEQQKRDSQIPKFEIPQFNGECQKWHVFKEIFLNTIHNAAEISKSQKLHYLQKLLKGDAATVIAGMVCSDETYDEAWNKLCDKFDKNCF